MVRECGAPSLASESKREECYISSSSKQPSPAQRPRICVTPELSYALVCLQTLYNLQGQALKDHTAYN